ncbi:HAD family hydrolase [Kiritimatiellota bacterium B12222]|nr:HAD family hydrolase [Kiritimatiellota bacterium B12222]
MNILTAPPALQQIKHVLIDIDGTLTDDAQDPQIDDQYFGGNVLLEMIRDLAVASGLSQQHVESELTRMIDELLFWDYPMLIEGVGLPLTESMEALKNWHPTNLEIYEDAVGLVHGLLEKGYILHVISNNPHSGCLLKLDAAGLLLHENRPVFFHIFNSTHQKGQKHQSEFWERAFCDGDLNPGECAVVGNHPYEDAKLPESLGIGAGFLVVRDQPAAEWCGSILQVQDLLQILPQLPSRVTL